MRFIAVLNEESGAAGTMDLEDYCAHLARAFQSQAHELRCKIITGSDLIETLQQSVDDSWADGILACGGDGTASAAAGMVYKGGKVLGILPAGTLNLFARSLNTPLDLYEAATALAKGAVKKSDIASANGRPFIHQYSVGMQPHIIQEREHIGYQSRLLKIIAGLRATLSVISRSSYYKVIIDELSPKKIEHVDFVAVSSNPYGKAHLPYPDGYNQEILGLYWAGKLSSFDRARLTADIFAGNWDQNPHLHEQKCEQVNLHFKKVTRHAVASIDGELVKLDGDVQINVHPGALKLLVPGGTL